MSDKIEISVDKTNTKTVTIGNKLPAHLKVKKSQPKLEKVDPAIADEVVTRNEKDRERIRAAAYFHNQNVDAQKKQQRFFKGMSKKERRRQKAIAKANEAVAQRLAEADRGVRESTEDPGTTAGRADGINEVLDKKINVSEAKSGKDT